MKAQESLRSGFEYPIVIKYLPPAWLFHVKNILHVLAIYSIYLASILIVFKLLFFIIVSYGLYLEIKEYFKRKLNQSCPILILDNKGGWRLTTEGKSNVIIKLVSVGFYSPFLIVLRFRNDAGGKYSFVLTGKTVEADTLRRLRVRLLYPVT